MNTHANKPITTSAIGIFGGTFDPIHTGHEQCAHWVADEFNLDKLIFIPAYIPPHKISQQNKPTATAKQRADMVDLVCQSQPHFSCDRRELERKGASYTLDTLKQLKALYPNDTLYFIIGMDSLLNFTSWYQYEEILTLCHLIVNTRPNYSLDELNHDTKALLVKYQSQDNSGKKQRSFGEIIFAKPIAFDISSSQIRTQLQNNINCEHLLNTQVAEFIKKNNLYR